LPYRGQREEAASPVVHAREPVDSHREAGNDLRSGTPNNSCRLARPAFRVHPSPLAAHHSLGIPFLAKTVNKLSKPADAPELLLPEQQVVAVALAEGRDFQ
jgi:hypothetical protein